MSTSMRFSSAITEFLGEPGDDLGRRVVGNIFAGP